MILFVALIVTVGLVASATKLAWDDEITAPMRLKLRDYRDRTGRLDGWVQALECPRCTSVRLSPVLTAPVIAVLGVVYDFGALSWLLAALAWIPVSFSVAYLAFIMIIRGEA